MSAAVVPARAPHRTSALAARNILGELDRQHLSVTALARRSGIPVGRLRRRLSAAHPITVCELGAVANALGVGVWTLVVEQQVQ